MILSKIPKTQTMKNTFAILFLLAMAGPMMAQTQCGAFFPFEKGAFWEMTNYNKKGAVSSITGHEIGIVEENNGVWEAQVKSKVSDDKGKVLNEGSYNVKCKDGTLFIDVADMLSPEMKEGMGSMEMSFSGDALTLPSRLEVGQALPDANTEVKAGSGGVTIMTLRFDITDRKVVAKETITVPAGTFDCYKITYTFTTKTILSKTFSVTSWHNEKAGVVRSETYDKKGVLESRSELSKLKL